MSHVAKPVVSFFLDLPMEPCDSDASEVCSICWDSAERGKGIAVLACSHLFHSECINRWNKIGNSCPLCRRRLFTIQPDSTSFFCENDEDLDSDEVVLVGDGATPYYHTV